LAVDYDVAHTTLMDYFKRPEVADELKQAERQLRAEQRVSLDRRSAERRLEREVRRRAKEQTARERKEDRQAAVVLAQQTARSRRSRTPYEAWLDERDARRPLTRADLRSPLDDIAEHVVARGGGIQEVLEATDLRTLENVVSSIDPAILKVAYDNDVVKQAPSR
jgi:hypothetical protein